MKPLYILSQEERKPLSIPKKKKSQSVRLSALADSWISLPWLKTSLESPGGNPLALVRALTLTQSWLALGTASSTNKHHQNQWQEQRQLTAIKLFPMIRYDTKCCIDICLSMLYNISMKISSQTRTVSIRRLKSYAHTACKKKSLDLKQVCLTIGQRSLITWENKDWRRGLFMGVLIYRSLLWF